MDANNPVNKTTSSTLAALQPQAWAHAGTSLLVIGSLFWIQSWNTSIDGTWVYYLAAIWGVVAGLILSHIIHEWCHYAGAVLAKSKVRVKPNVHPLFFDFDIPANSSAQFLCLSVGGLLGNVFLIATLSILPSHQNIALTGLLAAALGQCVFVIVLELPVSIEVLAGEKPLTAITDHFSQGGPLFLRAALLGVITATLVFLLY